MNDDSLKFFVLHIVGCLELLLEEMGAWHYS